MTKFRFGFPYAKPSGDCKAAWVELASSTHPGFREINYEGERYRLPQEDPGPRILDVLDGRGCVGKLHQNGEGRGIIDQHTYMVAGHGRSMQLALVMASQLDHYLDPSLPLVLMSAAIEHPFGAPAFQGARIICYAEAEKMKTGLLDKYDVAVQAGAAFLALPERDALILSDALHERGDKPTCINLDTKVQHKTDGVFILGLKESDLPRFASFLGVQAQAFQIQTEVKTKRGHWWEIAVSVLVLVVIMVWLKSDKSDDLKRRHDLLNVIYASESSDIHRRIKDEAVKEFLYLERQLEWSEYSKTSGGEEESDRIDLKDVNLSSSDLHLCELEGINFLNANFDGANLNRSNLKGSYLKAASLKETHLYRADLTYTILFKADFSRANLRGADFLGSIGLELCTLTGALFDDRTRWPDGFSAEQAKAKGAVYSSIEEKPVFIHSKPKSNE